MATEALAFLEKWRDVQLAIWLALDLADIYSTYVFLGTTTMYEINPAAAWFQRKFPKTWGIPVFAISLVFALTFYRLFAPFLTIFMLAELWAVVNNNVRIHLWRKRNPLGLQK